MVALIVGERSAEKNFLNVSCDSLAPRSVLRVGGESPMRAQKPKTMSQRVVPLSGMLVLTCVLSLSAQQVSDSHKPLRSVPTAPAGSDRHQDSEVIYDSTTEEWGSLFASSRPNPRIRELLATEGPSGREPASCSDSSSERTGIVRFHVLRHLLSWFRVPTVHAQGCPRIRCSGHYMIPDYRPCLGDCEDYFLFFRSGGHEGMYHLGYQQVGGTTCCKSGQCAETGCTNWY